MVDGQPVSYEQTVSDEEIGITVGGVALTLPVAPPNSGSSSGSSSGFRLNPETGEPELGMTPGEPVAFEMGGLKPGSAVSVSLPGSNGRELSNITVGDDGVAHVEIEVPASRTEAPVAVGAQLIQMTATSEEAGELVLAMTVIVAQGDPAPEPNRGIGELPELAPGEALATTGGIATDVDIVVDVANGGVALVAGDWQLGINVLDGYGTLAPASGATPVIRLVEDGFTEVRGQGMMPGSRADVYMFSDPVLLGSFTVAGDGSFAGRIKVDSALIAVGEHTLQVQGLADDGFVRAANIGVVVEKATQGDLLAPETSTGAGSSPWRWWLIGLGILGVFFLLLLAKKSSDDEDDTITV